MKIKTCFFIQKPHGHFYQILYVCMSIDSTNRLKIFYPGTSGPISTKLGVKETLALIRDFTIERYVTPVKTLFCYFSC